MTLEQMIASFTTLSKNKKAKFLSSLGMRFTILVRVYCDEISDQSDLLFRISNVNELYHKIFGCISVNLSSSQSGYPDDAIVTSLLMRSQDMRIERDFVEAWNCALKSVEDHRA